MKLNTHKQKISVDVLRVKQRQPKPHKNTVTHKCREKLSQLERKETVPETTTPRGHIPTKL